MPPSELLKRVRAAIRHTIALESFSFATVAQAMGISPSDLRKRLADDGVQFSSIDRGCTQKPYIMTCTNKAGVCQKLPIDSGYADQSAFTRLFGVGMGYHPGNISPVN